MVALIVGEEGQKYYAHEGTLCGLKYFQDILEGPLQAVPEKIINMPEDPKEAVLALVEYLYTGKYHFQTSLEKKNQETQPQDAPTNIIQMKFHAEVHKIAKKYQCQGLLVASHASVVSIMKESQYDTDINRLRLWKIVYSVPVMSIVDNRDFNTVEEWIRKLLKENRDELRDFFQEYPEFACEILDILAS